MNDLRIILEKIEEADIITIFRHTRPDGDAAGSQLGLKEWISYHYPQKEVYACGKEVFDTYPYVDEVDDETIKESLAIILDTSNHERVDDERYAMAKTTIKIDHHPANDAFADYNFVNENAGALCEYLTLILDSFNKPIPQCAAKYLYSGILTDTLSFRTASTNKSSLKAAYILAETGIDLYDITENIFKQSERIFNFRTYLRTKIKNENGLAYVIFEEDDYAKYQVSDSVARFQVAEMNGVEDFKIWCIFTKNNAGRYDGSLRSKRIYSVNDIAEHYGGGGHKNAAGVKNLSTGDLEMILSELRTRINSL